PDGHGTRDHWDLTAHDLLVGVILHVLYAERDKTLHGCLTILSDPDQPIETRLSAMLTAVHDPDGTGGWTGAAGQPTRTHPAVAGAARALLNKSDNERSSVISSAVKFLNLYRDPVVVRNTETSDFAVQDLMHAEAPVSLYLTIPPADIHRTRPLLRLLLHQIVSRLTEAMDFADGRTVAGYRHPLLLMLDEFPTLGRMDVLASEQETSRPLLTPDEVMRLPEDAARSFVAGQPPMYGRKIRYYLDRVFSERAKISPPERSGRLTHDWNHWAARVARTEEA